MSSAAVDLLIRATMLAAAAWLATAVLRRRSASLRALIWTTALGGLLVLPALSEIAPTWRVEVWRAPAAAPVHAEPAPAAMAALPQRDASDAAFALSPSTAGAPIPTSPPELIEADAVAGVSWGTAAWLLWMLVTVALWLRIASSHFRLARVANGTSDDEAARGEWAELLDETRATLGISRTVSVKISRRSADPRSSACGVPSCCCPLTRTVGRTTSGEPSWCTSSPTSCAGMRWGNWSARWRARVTGSCRSSGTAPGVRPRSASARATTWCCALACARRRMPRVSSRWRCAPPRAPGPRIAVLVLAMAQPSRLRERVVAILDPRMRRDAIGRGATIAAFFIVARWRRAGHAPGGRHARSQCSSGGPPGRRGDDCTPPPRRSPRRQLPSPEPRLAPLGPANPSHPSRTLGPSDLRAPPRPPRTFGPLGPSQAPTRLCDGALSTRAPARFVKTTTAACGRSSSPGRRLQSRSQRRRAESSSTPTSRT